MTLGDALGLSDAQEWLLVRVLQAGLLGLLVYGLVTLQFGMAASGGLTLAVTLLPALLRREYGYTMDAGLVLWLTVAVVLHAAGALGMYRQFSWYDEVTHTVTSTIVAGIGYAVVRAFEEHSEEIDMDGDFRAVFVVVFVLAFGVFWEIVEFGSVRLSRLLGVGTPLVVFGIDDIVTDFVFNAVGAVVVALWGTRYFDGVGAFLHRRLRSKSEQ